jgi:hypothetical protein
VLFWGLASREVNEAIELYATLKEAERTLADALADEPAWEDVLFVAPIELGEAQQRPSLN